MDYINLGGSDSSRTLIDSSYHYDKDNVFKYPILSLGMRNNMNKEKNLFVFCINICNIRRKKDNA